MKILWLTWKDPENPLAGGAEIVHDELAKRLAADGHEVVFIVPNFPGSSAEAKRKGYTIRRVGSRVTVYWEAYKLYKKEFQEWPDLVIDSYFVIPFFARFYVKQHCVLFVHNLCRVIWFYQMWFPANLLGYLLEPVYLQFLLGMKVITISQSTKKDLMRYGFSSDDISIISEGIEITPIQRLEDAEKYPQPTILSLGSLRAMKRTKDIVRAFEMVKRTNADAQLIVAGHAEDKYGRDTVEMIKKSPYASSIQYLGRVSKEKKIELMRKSHIICVTSVKEGWGLIVTEANSQGTPAVVYDADGLRDSVQSGKTGLICESTPNALVQALEKCFASSIFYNSLQQTGWNWSRRITFEQAYSDLQMALSRI